MNDKAQALASYAKQAGDDSLMKMATRIRDRAIRRSGELLKQIEPKRGSNQNIGVGDRPKVETRTEVAASAGMSPHQTKQAIRVANVPADQFEKLVESEAPPTVTKLAEMGEAVAVQIKTTVCLPGGRLYIWGLRKIAHTQFRLACDRRRSTIAFDRKRDALGW